MRNAQLNAEGECKDGKDTVIKNGNLSHRFSSLQIWKRSKNSWKYNFLRYINVSWSCRIWLLNWLNKMIGVISFIGSPKRWHMVWGIKGKPLVIVYYINFHPKFVAVISKGKNKAYRINSYLNGHIGHLWYNFNCNLSQRLESSIHSFCFWFGWIFADYRHVGRQRCLFFSRGREGQESVCIILPIPGRLSQSITIESIQLCSRCRTCGTLVFSQEKIISKQLSMEH